MQPICIVREICGTGELNTTLGAGELSDGSEYTKWAAIVVTAAEAEAEGMEGFVQSRRLNVSTEKQLTDMAEDK